MRVRKYFLPLQVGGSRRGSTSLHTDPHPNLPPCRGKEQGFTLLELSIVLMIIVILVMFLLMGRSMIDQSIKRAVVGEMDRYVHAVNLFSDHYKQMPGDMVGASAIWGAGTADGDGNGIIGDYNGVGYGAPAEFYQAWQHLADAGFIDGKYSGAVNNAGALLGLSVPKSAYPKGGYTLLFRYVSAPGTADDFAFTGHHVIEFGAVDPACAGGGPSDCITHSALLPPADALEIDEKMDDGRPGTGSITSRPPNANPAALNPNCTVCADCTAATLPYASQYNTAFTTAACGLIIDTKH